MRLSGTVTSLSVELMVGWYASLSTPGTQGWEGFCHSPS